MDATVVASVTGLLSSAVSTKIALYLMFGVGGVSVLFVFGLIAKFIKQLLR